MAKDDSSAQTGAYLRLLLVRPGDPRSAWQRYADHTPAGEIDYPAVARVLRERMPGLASPITVETVEAALDGTALCPMTLTAFIEAFAIGQRHAIRLHDLRRGSSSVRVISGSAFTDLRQPSGPARHETVSVHELHTLGPDGLPAEHQTIQVIKSTVDQLDTYPFGFDTDEVVVEVVRGGRVGDMYRVADNLYAVDVVLTAPLALGETTLTHHRTTFHYRRPPATEFRRGVKGTMRDITLWVQFHPQRLPAHIWTGEWTSLQDSTATHRQRVELDGDYSVQVRYDALSDVIVGFGWSWD